MDLASRTWYANASQLFDIVVHAAHLSPGSVFGVKPALPARGPSSASEGPSGGGVGDTAAAAAAAAAAANDDAVVGTPSLSQLVAAGLLHAGRGALKVLVDRRAYLADVEELGPGRYVIVWRHRSHRDGAACLEIFATPTAFARRVLQEYFAAVGGASQSRTDPDVMELLQQPQPPTAAAATAPGAATAMAMARRSSVDEATAAGWRMVVRAHDGYELCKLWNALARVVRACVRVQVPA